MFWKHVFQIFFIGATSVNFNILELWQILKLFFITFQQVLHTSFFWISILRSLIILSLNSDKEFKLHLCLMTIHCNQIIQHINIWVQKKMFWYFLNSVEKWSIYIYIHFVWKNYTILYSDFDLRNWNGIVHFCSDFQFRKQLFLYSSRLLL